MTYPGADVGDIFRHIAGMYRELGDNSGVYEVHQGGPTGIGIREYLATKDHTDLVFPNQAFTWNPVFRTGKDKAKCEDTIITGKREGYRARNLTVDPYGWWPMLKINIGSKEVPFDIPGILVR